MTFACLGTDGTELNNYNWKVQWAPFEGNKFAFQNTWAEKFKNARNASDTRPIETTFRQKAVSSDFGTFGWTTGPTPLWKASDQHVINDAGSSTCCGRTWGTTSSSTSMRMVLPRAAAAGSKHGRGEVVRPVGPFIRPTHSFDATTSYFLPGALGGDHALKAGFPLALAKELGGASAATTTSATSTVSPVRLRCTGTRSPTTISARMPHLQDAYTVGRMTLNAGVRWDRQANEALASSVPEHPFLPDWLPSVSFDGKTHRSCGTTSRRASANYDLSGTGRRW